MDHAALAKAALEHSPDGVGGALAGVADHERDPSQAELFERANKVTPERLAFAVATLRPGSSRRPSAFTPMAMTTALEQTCIARPKRP